MSAILAMLLAAGPRPVAILPADAPELPHEAARGAADSLASALPPPFRPLELDARAVREHLAAGPSCRADPACLCAAAELSEGQLALDLAVTPSGGAWAVDLRLLAPCDGQRLGRRAEIVPAGIPGLQRFLEATVPALLRGRDLPRVPRVEAPADSAAEPALPVAPAQTPSSPTRTGPGGAAVRSTQGVR
jgi:hypothetical protein